MKAKLTFFTTSAALLMVALAGNEPAADADAATLRKRIADLEARVKALESRLEKPGAAANLPAIQLPQPNAPQPDAVPFPSAGSGHGKIWGKRQINGWNFYIVPCAPEALPAAGPDKVLFK